MPLAAKPLPVVRRNARVRRLQPSDLRAFQAYRSDPILARYQGWSPMSEEAANRFIDEMTDAALFRPDQWIQLAIADPATDQLLGDIGLHLSSDGSVAEVGFTLAREAQGRGIATAAAEAALALVFEHIAVSRVVGVTDARNLPSIRLLVRLGMRQVESRQAVFKGEQCTELVFSIERWRPLSSNVRLHQMAAVSTRVPLLRFATAVERDAAIDAWFESRAGKLGAIARPWYERMRECGDDVRELLHDGHPTACVGDAAFGYVNAFKAHANVGFFLGAHLADPAGLLEGTGKNMRHVKLRPGTEIDREALTALIQAAYWRVKSQVRSGR